MMHVTPSFGDCISTYCIVSSLYGNLTLASELEYHLLLLLLSLSSFINPWPCYALILPKPWMPRLPPPQIVLSLFR